MTAPSSWTDRVQTPEEIVEGQSRRYVDSWQVGDGPRTLAVAVVAALREAGHLSSTREVVLRCVVDDCSYEPGSYAELNEHSRQCHLESNPFRYGTSHRYPGVDRAGDFIWWALDKED